MHHARCDTRAFGQITPDAANVADPLVLDADPGRVRLLVTHLSGTVVAINEGQVDMDLTSVDRRRIKLFNFAGTGMEPMYDADPENYEVATGALPIRNATIAPARKSRKTRAQGVCSVMSESCPWRCEF